MSFAHATSVALTLGTLEDPHHALCYRVYNLFRENEAHRYVQAPPNLPEATPSWSDLQKQALDLLSGSKPTTPGQPGDEPSSNEEPAPVDPPTDGEEPAAETEPAAPPAAGTTTAAHGCCAAPSSSSAGTLAPFVLGIAALLVARRRRAND